MSGERKFVLLLKSHADGPTDPYIQALQQANIQATCVPVLGFNFVNIDNLQQYLSQPGNYQGLIVSSPRAVESIALASKSIEDAWESKLLRDWQQKLIFVVGEATGRELETIGLYSQGADTGNADNLADLIINTDDVKDSGLPFLMPMSSLGRDVLPVRLAGAGIGVDRVTTYETVPHADLRDNLQQAAAHQTVSHIVFYSPSGVEFSWDTWKSVGIDLRRIKSVAIGPTTQKALEQRGISPTVASKPTPEHVLAAILSAS